MDTTSPITVGITAPIYGGFALRLMFTSRAFGLLLVVSVRSTLFFVIINELIELACMSIISTRRSVTLVREANKNYVRDGAPQQVTASSSSA